MELTQHVGPQSCHLLRLVRGTCRHDVKQLVDAKGWRRRRCLVGYGRCRIGNESGHVCPDCTSAYRDRGEGRERRATSQGGTRWNIKFPLQAMIDVAAVDACALNARLRECGLLGGGGISEKVRAAVAQGKRVRVAASARQDHDCRRQQSELRHTARHARPLLALPENCRRLTTKRTSRKRSNLRRRWLLARHIGIRLR